MNLRQWAEAQHIHPQTAYRSPDQDFSHPTEDHPNSHCRRVTRWFRSSPGERYALATGHTG